MRFSTSTLGANYHFQPKSVVDPNHLGNVLTVVSDRKIAVASAQDWLDEFTNNDALNQAAAWNTVGAPSNTKSIDTDRIKFTSSNVNVGLGKTFATPDATGTNYQISFDLDKGSCTQIKIVVFTAYGQSTPVYSNIVSASGTYVIPFTSQSVIAWIEVKKMADNGVSQSFYLDNIKLNNLSNPSQQVAYFTADIVSSTDYYAFGGKLPGRSFNSNSMKYQFNGKEFDPETGTQDYGMRIYNPALGRFLSVDPIGKNFAYYTPYQFAGNKPIAAIDLDGLEDVFFTEIDKIQYMQIAYTAEDIESSITGSTELKLRVHYEGKTTGQFEGPNKANENKIFQQKNEIIKSFVKEIDKNNKEKVENKDIGGYIIKPFKSQSYLIPKAAKTTEYTPKGLFPWYDLGINISAGNSKTGSTVTLNEFAVDEGKINPILITGDKKFITNFTRDLVDQGVPKENILTFDKLDKGSQKNFNKDNVKQNGFYYLNKKTVTKTE